MLLPARAEELAKDLGERGSSVTSWAGGSLAEHPVVRSRRWGSATATRGRKDFSGHPPGRARGESRVVGISEVVEFARRQSPLRQHS